MSQHELDLLGEVCPVPLYKTQQKLEEMNQGETLVVYTDFTRSVRNIMNLSIKLNYPIDVQETRNGGWVITLTKV